MLVEVEVGCDPLGAGVPEVVVVVGPVLAVDVGLGVGEVVLTRVVAGVVGSSRAVALGVLTTVGEGEGAGRTSGGGGRTMR